jgi:hypothetical protein
MGYSRAERGGVPASLPHPQSGYEKGSSEDSLWHDHPQGDLKQARQSLFPHSNKVAYGGCVRRIVTNAKTGRIISRSADLRQVTYCSKCREAESAWQKQRAKGLASVDTKTSVALPAVRSLIPEVPIITETELSR